MTDFIWAMDKNKLQQAIDANKMGNGFVNEKKIKEYYGEIGGRFVNPKVPDRVMVVRNLSPLMMTGTSKILESQIITPGEVLINPDENVVLMVHKNLKESAEKVVKQVKRNKSKKK